MKPYRQLLRVFCTIIETSEIRATRQA